jgi:hypothetical protein
MSYLFEFSKQMTGKMRWLINIAFFFFIIMMLRRSGNAMLEYYQTKKSMKFTGIVLKREIIKGAPVYTILSLTGTTFKLYSLSSEFDNIVIKGDTIKKETAENKCLIIKADTSFNIPFAWVPDR